MTGYAMENLKWKVGDASITRIVESDATLAIYDLLPTAIPARVAAHRAWLQPHFIDDSDQIKVSFHSLVIKSQGKIIVVDTCIGEHGDPFAPGNPASATFLQDIAMAGFPREKVDVVLCTHLHYDHVGWNTMLVDGKWTPTFPNARYLFAKVEYDHWQQESDKPFANNFNNAVKAVFDAGLAELVDMDYRITDEVRLLSTPGHSPGHVSVLIQSGGQQALITGDVSHHPVQWAEPEWSLPMVDFDETVGIETRRRIAAEHVNTDTLLIGTHYPSPTAGHLVSVNGEIQFTTKSKL
jgi:glyoxylase-like metal-dependent hydrolase (beta-lactamase superfamily II)